MKEIWKDIEGYEGLYQVSNLGIVKSLYRKVSHFSGERVVNEMVLKRAKVKDYEMIVLNKKGRRKMFYVHRLVAAHFISNMKNNLEVNHIDGNKRNNRADNLEWVTSSENRKHAFDIGLSKIGKENRKCDKLTEADVRVIKQMIKAGVRVYKIHEKFKSVVGRTTIYEIKAGRTWKNVKS